MIQDQPEKALTPGEYLQRAYDRIIKVGEEVLKLRKPVTYNTESKYFFDFDEDATYKYILTDNSKLHYPEGRIVFQRQSDGKILHATKFSEPPVEVKDAL